VLVARVRNLLRRPRLESAGNELLRAGAIEVDVGRHEVRVDGAEVTLTHTEFEILRALMSAPGRVRTRGDILSRLDQGQHVLERTGDVHVASLRKKLGSAGELISTVRGVGYRLRD
jgi:two-component system alkaline phosphatase synthesis response regulator PhoP